MKCKHKKTLIRYSQTLQKIVLLNSNKFLQIKFSIFSNNNKNYQTPKDCLAQTPKHMMNLKSDY
jgi:hypothetical protein